MAYADYYSESPLEKRQANADRLALKLRRLPASKFNLDEIALLLRTNWSHARTVYYTSECEEIEQLAKREGVE